MNRPLRLAECSLGISWVDVECLRSVRHVIGRPFAAVGADLSCPCIRKRPRNGGRKCVFNEMNAGIWRIGYVYLVIWKHIFDDVRIRAR